MDSSCVQGSHQIYFDSPILSSLLETVGRNDTRTRCYCPLNCCSLTILWTLGCKNTPPSPTPQHWWTCYPCSGSPVSPFFPVLMLELNFSKSPPPLHTWAAGAAVWLAVQVLALQQVDLIKWPVSIFRLVLLQIDLILWSILFRIIMKYWSWVKQSQF